MQNLSQDSIAVTDQNEHDRALQTYFKAGISPDDISAVFPLRRAQGVLQAFSALFHGGFNAVLLRLLVLRELTADAHTTTFSRADINAKLAYLEADSLETVLARFRSTGILTWDASHSVYRISSTARNVLAALEALLQTDSDEAEMSYLLTQVAGAQAVGGVSVEQLHHLLGRLIALTEEFSDAIASGSEFQLRAAQKKWHTACDWVEKGSQIIYEITHSETQKNSGSGELSASDDLHAAADQSQLQSQTQSQTQDAAIHKAAHAIGRAQSALLNMQGMFSRALNQIERQRVHLGQSGISTTDIKTWLLQQDDLASLADNALALPVTPVFITPSEMIDVAESELLAHRVSLTLSGLPEGENAPEINHQQSAALLELDHWLDLLSRHTQNQAEENQENPDSATSVAVKTVFPLADLLLPSSFAIASYRASLLPLLDEQNEATLLGSTAALARLPLRFETKDKMQKISSERSTQVAAMSQAQLLTKEKSYPQNQLNNQQTNQQVNKQEKNKESNGETA